MLNEQQKQELENLAKPLVKFLNENCHPHTHLNIDQTHIQLFEGVCGIPINGYLKD